MKQDDLNGIFLELPGLNGRLAEMLEVTFYYVRLMDGAIREDDLVNVLCDYIVPYCLNRSSIKKVPINRIRSLYLDAKGRFQRSSSNSGEPGEILAYFLIEGCLEAPKILTKMTLKTNPSMPVHGSDGVHLRIGESDVFALHFAESKLYKNPTEAIDSALDSVRHYVSPIKTSTATMRDYEVNLVSGNLDIPNGKLRNYVLDILNPYSAARDNLQYWHTCIIGFDMDLLCGRVQENELIQEYCRLARHFNAILLKKIESDDLLLSQRWNVFFVPLPSVQSFRNKFAQALAV
ncbi:MAG: DUF1837 domain-containing protein [Dehalococcoidia bacterium]